MTEIGSSDVICEARQDHAHDSFPLHGQEPGVRTLLSFENDTSRANVQV